VEASNGASTALIFEPHAARHAGRVNWRAAAF
jgi:hypothetical protein